MRLAATATLIALLSAGCATGHRHSYDLDQRIQSRQREMDELPQKIKDAQFNLSEHPPSNGETAYMNSRRR